MTPGSDAKAQIEQAIERARAGMSQRIDEIDRRLRADLDLQKIASEHGPQLVAAGVAMGFVIGYGVPKAILRVIQIGVPIAIALRVAKSVGDTALEESLV